MKTVERSVTVEVWIGHSDLLTLAQKCFTLVLQVTPHTAAVLLSTHDTSLQCPVDLFELHNSHKTAKGRAQLEPDGTR